MTGYCGHCGNQICECREIEASRARYKSQFHRQLAALLDRPGMDTRIAESIFTAREGYWNFKKWNSDPRIKEAYIKDAQAVLTAIKDAAND